MGHQPLSRRSAEPFDAGVPLSDLFADPRIPTFSNDDIARGVRNLWQGCLDSSRDFRMRQWVRNVLMTYGEEDFQWSQRLDRWLTVPIKRTRRYKTPLLPGRLAYFAARMTQSAPDWATVPASDSVSDEEDAHFCDKVLRYAYREQRVDLGRYFATIQMSLFGFGLLEAGVDEEARLELEYEIEYDSEGKPLFNPSTGLPIYKVDSKGKPRIAEVTTKPGITVKPVSPFSFVVPPGMEWPHLPDAPYVIRARWMSESEVRRRFEVGSDVVLSGEHAGDTYGSYEAMNSYLSQAMNPSSLPVTRFESGRLLVLQYFEKARDIKGFYEGKVYTVCGNKLIGNERSLFDDGRFPFFAFPWLPITDSFYAFPWLNPQTDPQSRINQTITHMMEHLGRVGSPNVIADRGSMFPPKPHYGYQVYFTSPGMRRPEFMQAPQMPTGAYEMNSQAQRDLDQAGMSYPLARGESAQGITSGLHARLVQDADQTEMGPIVRMHAATFGALGEAVLDLYRDYGGDDRILAIVGDDKAHEFFSFKRSKIPIGMRVYVQEESLLVHYRSALEERAVQLGTAGAFGALATDPNAQKRFLRAIRDPHMGGPLTPEECQKQYLDQIHAQIIHEGKVPAVEPWWDLNAHRAGAHERMCRESLRWDDAQKASFMQYWQALEEAAKKVEAEAQAASIKQAETMIALQGKADDLAANAKAKVELLRGTNKLAVESMKQSNNEGAGAGAGVAAASGKDGGDEGDTENAE